MASGVRQSINRILVVYDGECAFCCRSVAEIRRRDPHDQFVYLPRQTPGLAERYPQLSIGDFETGMRAIEPDGRMHVGSDAIYQIVSRLPYFRRVAWIYHLPLIHGLTRRIYAWVARNRMGLSQFCERRGACEMRADQAKPEASRPAAPGHKLERRQLLISLLIFLVIGLHVAADVAKTINASSWVGSGSWPFLAYGMYRNSFPPGPITTTKRRIIGVTAGGEEIAISATSAGLFGSWALSRYYVGPIIRGDSGARQRLGDRLNVGRVDPVIGFRVESEVYVISDSGMIKQEQENLIFPVGE